MNIQNLKLNKKYIVLALFLLFDTCIIISILSFKFKWGVWPDLSEALIGHTLLAFFALPKAFGDTLGITNINSTKGVIPMMLVYWPVFLALLWFTLRSRMIIIFILLALVSIASSLKWQIVSTGMIGI